MASFRSHCPSVVAQLLNLVVRLLGSGYNSRQGRLRFLERDQCPVPAPGQGLFARLVAQAENADILQQVIDLPEDLRQRQVAPFPESPLLFLPLRLSLNQWRPLPSLLEILLVLFDQRIP